MLLENGGTGVPLPNYECENPKPGHASPKETKEPADGSMTEGPMTEGPMTEGPMTEGPMAEGPMT